jgi:hypothetical protein
VLLSYLHFETPGDAAGHRVLLNMIGYLRGAPADREAASKAAVKTRAAVGRGLWRAPAPAPASAPEAAAAIERAAAAATGPQADVAALAGSLAEAAAQLLEFGRRNFLWFQRNDWLLQWRRGVRGIEYSTLYAMLRQLAELAGKDAAARRDDRPATGGIDSEMLARLNELVTSFVEDAPSLLMLERRAFGHGPLSPLMTEDPQIAALRKRLFSTTKRCGGLYREIVDLADAVLLPLLRKN